MAETGESWGLGLKADVLFYLGEVARPDLEW